MTKQKKEKSKIASEPKDRYTISTDVNEATKQAFIELAERMGKVSEAALARMAISAFLAANSPRTAHVVKK